MDARRYERMRASGMVEVSAVVPEEVRDALLALATEEERPLRVYVSRVLKDYVAAVREFRSSKKGR